MASWPSDSAPRSIPPPLVYAKPAAVVRHLESAIGRGAVDAGLRTLLTRHSNRAPTTRDLIRCWESAAGRDLREWTDEWLMTAGVNTLELVLETSPDGIVRRAEVIQSVGPGGRLRTHHLQVRAFDGGPTRVAARPPVPLTVVGEATPVRALVGSPAPSLAVLNAPATTYAKVRLDERSRATLATSLGGLDADIRAACWVAGREMAEDDLIAPAEIRQWVARHRHAETDPQVLRQLDALTSPS